MTTYVALLRGVNVGVHGRVDMAELRAAFERLGCTDVATVINSGNVIFRDRRRAPTLTRELEDALGRRVAVRTLAQMEALCRRIPADWGNDRMQKTDVAFLLDRDEELLWHALRENLAPREGADWGVAEVTVRNVNTVRRLTGLMRSR